MPLRSSDRPTGHLEGQPPTPAAPPTSGPAADGSSAASAERDPRCVKDAFDRGDLTVVPNAVAACVNRQFFGDRVAVATLARALGTRTGEGTLVKCRGGVPDITLIDAGNRAVVVSFCAQLGVREARVGGLQTILTADPAAVEAWLRERGVDVTQVR